MSRSARAADFLGRPGIGRAARALPLWSGLLVLVHHRISDGGRTQIDGGVTSGTREQLDAQLGFLRENADLVAPDDVPDVLGRRGRHVLLTFDDGYRDNYDNAYPVLRAHGVSAAFFVVSGFIDRPRVPWWDEFAWMANTAPDAVLPAGRWLDADLPLRDAEAAVVELTGRYKALPAAEAEELLAWCGETAGCGRADPALAEGLWMTWDMAREMRDGGMAFGGHTHTHPVLARLDREGQRRELERCRERLGEELDRAMRLFSYPVGLRDSFDSDTRELLRELGVEAAFSCYGGVQERGGDPLDVKRANLSSETDLDRLNAMLIAPKLFARW